MYLAGIIAVVNWKYYCGRNDIFRLGIAFSGAISEVGVGVTTTPCGTPEKKDSPSGIGRWANLILKG